MARLNYLLILLPALLLALPNLCFSLDADRKVYIVYMGSVPRGQYQARAHHQTILQRVLRGSSVSDSLIYSYSRSFNGFAANLTSEEQMHIADMEDVVSVFPSRNFELHTTRSWDFVGLHVSATRMAAVESDLIIGVLDSGIRPESDSFRDEGLGPPPKKWKGICQSTKNFTCNNKLIGARFYKGTSSDGSAIDMVGHGSHTASIAAGRDVRNASLFGLAQGTARGAVPSARLAVYKVCSYLFCLSSDILAGFDDAIADGVDFISVSLGGRGAADYPYDVIAIGSFHGMANGILTSQSAGNSGPEPGTLASVAPWMFTVAASSTDRRIINKVSLGDGQTFVGNAINTFRTTESKTHLIYGGDAPDSCSPDAARYCYPGCLKESLVKGKVVFCEGMTSKLGGPIKAGTKGVIMEDETYSDISLTYPLPASLFSVKLGTAVKTYINSSKEPQANILRSEEINDRKAPVVVSFSSRGPNSITSDILKPDITAPGVAILAAFSPAISMTGSPDDKRHVKYNIISGTSMSCPHVTGSAAYVKSFHPSWSPAAVKSALMTTASLMSRRSNKDAEFAYGAGQIDPVKAVDPGLVYDIQKSDYIQMLCNQGYSTKQIRLISGDKSTCPQVPVGTVRDLNYPSMAVRIVAESSFSVKFSRTLTNVGSPDSTYKATISPSNLAMKITITPQVLKFSSENKRRSFVVTVSGGGLETSSLISTQLVWSDNVHSVRSPIVVYT